MTRIYDLVMTHKLDADDLFIHRVQQHCAEAGLNFFLVEPVWVEPFCDLFAKGRIWARALLNMHSEHHLPEDVFHRLVRLAHERKTRVIDPPDVAAAAFDKARLHDRLAAAGFLLPFTLIVPREQVENLVLSDLDRAALGAPFVIKPAMGYGRRGVILDATNERDLARSVAAWPDGHYLLQRRIIPRMSNGEPLYFRVFYVFGSTWCCWWNCFTDRYRLPTPAEEEQWALASLRDLAHRHGALFILDEMIAGFRMDIGGAQAVYDVEPDLSTFGKALGNGFAISALVGPRTLLGLGGIRDDRERVFTLSTTHGAEVHALAALLAVIDTYEVESVIDRLDDRGRRLALGAGQAIDRHGLGDTFQLLGRPSNLVFSTLDRDGNRSQPFRTLVLQELISRGVLGPSFVVSAALSDADIDRTVSALDETLGVYERALEDGIERYLRGRPVKPVFRPYA